MGVGVFENCDALTIFYVGCYQPSGWDENWNPSDCPVIWDCDGIYGGAIEDNDDYIDSPDVFE